MKTNKQIDKLAEQCYVKTGSAHTDHFDYVKFAELIVDQMLEITDAHTEVFQTDRDKALVEHIKQSVKQHFGVEQ